MRNCNGRNIALFRKKKRWTQKNLAEATLLSNGYIAAVEREKKCPSIKTLAIIAARLEVGVEELF
jgi:putative transcriptional regulator